MQQTEHGQAQRGDEGVDIASRSGLSREILCLVSFTAKRGTIKATYLK
jgi:hypothetical protein